MKIDLDRAAKSIRKLRRLLKTPSSPTPPEQVHELRTQTRKLGALVRLLSPEFGGNLGKALRLMKTLSKTAGKTRDLDVLIAKAASLGPLASAEVTARLVKHLAARRLSRGKYLDRQMKERRRKARAILKRGLQEIDDLRMQSSLRAVAWPSQALAARVDNWPNVGSKNLHEFRKCIRELRYMLQLAVDSRGELLHALEFVNDSTGDWHDWMELNDVAKSVLNGEADGLLLAEIRKILNKKLRTALSAARSFDINRFAA